MTFVLEQLIAQMPGAPWASPINLTTFSTAKSPSSNATRTKRRLYFSVTSESPMSEKQIKVTRVANLSGDAPCRDRSDPHTSVKIS